MTTHRYSGLVTARITYIDAECGYRVYLSTPTTMARNGRTYFFPERSIPGGYPLAAVDAVETFDAVARVAFARAAFEDMCADSSDFSHGNAWTSRPSHLLAAFNTPDGFLDEREAAGSVYHTDVVVHRSKRETGAWLAEHASKLP